METSLSEKELKQCSNPSSILSFWVSKSVKFLKSKAKVPSRSSSKRYHFDGMLVSNSVYCDSPSYIEEKMEACELQEDGKKHGIRKNEEDQSGESSSSSDFLASEVTLIDENSSSVESSSPPLIWEVKKEVCEEVENPHLDKRKLTKQGSSCVSETEMMKERFGKLLLGEDMSGCGNGVCTALAISNAITNLCGLNFSYISIVIKAVLSFSITNFLAPLATLFGQIWRLEPLQPEKKVMWRREMDWILCVSDHIVELVPSLQTFPDGSILEVMTSRPRLDLYVNLPALRKLDNMLLEILDSFEIPEFWYVEQGILAPEADGTLSFRNPNQENKWWLPVPRVLPRGLTEDSRRMLQQKRDSTNQIHKAAMAINNAALAEMETPDAYIESLPKNGKASLGDVIHRYISSDHFSPECLLDSLDVSSEHHALEVANRLEAAIHLWRKKINSKPSLHTTHRSNSRSSWEMVRDLVTDADKREVLAGRAESLLLCLKLRFPGLPQTTLDSTKIQCNKDVGKSILEGYSRVLESLAFNIVARIDELLYVDDMSKHSDQLISISKVGFAAPRMSPSPLMTPAKESSKLPLVKRILTDYLSMDGKGKEVRSSIERSAYSRDFNLSISSSF